MMLPLLFLRSTVRIGFLIFNFKYFIPCEDTDLNLGIPVCLCVFTALVYSESAQHPGVIRQFLLQ